MGDEIFDRKNSYRYIEPAYGKTWLYASAGLRNYQNGSIFPSDPINTFRYDRLGPISQLENFYFTPGAGNTFQVVLNFVINIVGTMTKLAFKPVFWEAPDTKAYNLNQQLRIYSVDDVETERSQQYLFFVKNIELVPLTHSYIDMTDVNNPYIKLIEPTILIYPEYAAGAFHTISFQMVAPADIMGFKLVYAPNTPSGTLQSDTGAIASVLMAGFSSKSNAVPPQHFATNRTIYP